MFFILVFALGLIFGSFANVLIWRLPQGKNLGGRSICPRCKKKILWFDNLPLLSFFLLQGRCRECKEKISLRYPMVELLTGLVFVLLYLKFGLSYKFIFFGLTSILLISIFVIDLTNQIIPDELVFFGIILSVLFNLSFVNLFSGFLAALFLLIIHFVTSGRGMGLGDVKFAVFGGMVVGLNHVFYWLVLAFLTGAIVGCILILGRKAKLKSKIAFGPFLVLALFLVIFF
jgi:prepilin signal peptidase PulO-like enzyme (type II secretory pathway)